MSGGEIGTEHVLDTRGMMCPEPISEAALALRTLAPGETLLVLATDPAAPIDFEAWCMRRRHDFLSCNEVENGWEIRLRKGTDQN